MVGGEGERLRVTFDDAALAQRRLAPCAGELVRRLVEQRDVAGVDVGDDSLGGEAGPRADVDRLQVAVVQARQRQGGPRAASA